MPIDFEPLVAPFRTAYFLQRRSIGESLRLLAVWLTRRLRETEERERATRGIQVLRFSGSSLAVWIDTSQHDALGHQGEPPPEGFWASVAAPFQALWRNLFLADSMIQAEQAIPRLLDVLARTVRMIVASLDRFTKPDASLFDLTRTRSWQDLFGEIGLFFRLVDNPDTRTQIETFSGGGVALIGVWRTHFPPAPEEGEGRSILPDASRWILGATLVIPAAWQLFAQIAAAAVVVIELKLLDIVAAIQRDLFALRRRAIDFLFVTVFGIGSKALEWLVITRAGALATLDLYTRVTTTVLTEVESWITATSGELKRFVDELVAFVRGLGTYLEGFMSIDFGGALTFGYATFSLDEILEWRENPAGAEALQKRIDDLLEERPVLTFLVRKRILAAREAIGILATPTRLPAEASPPGVSGITFPDIADSFLLGAEATALRASLASAGPTLTTRLDEAFMAGVTALTAIAGKAAQAGTKVRDIGSANAYRAMTARVGRLAEAAFGADAMRAGLERRRDPIATAFETWLAGQGFALIEKALPKYVAEMIAFWKREAARPAADRPTSAHITAKRAQLGRVKVPRLVIRVGEARDLDKALAVELADRAGAGVAQAFQMALAVPAG
jgi:hypothetical protein